MKHPLALSSSDSEDASEEEHLPRRVQDVGVRGKRVRTYSKSDEGKTSRLEVSFKEDNSWDKMVDNKKSRRDYIKETKAKSNEVSTGGGEDLDLFQSISRGVVGNFDGKEKKSFTRGKQKKTTKEVTPKKLRKLPLAPASKSPTEEDCSYGWQQSCWHCSERKSTQLRLCSACQVAAYCSPRCQQEGWSYHKERCKRECEAQASASILIDEETRSKVEMKKVTGRNRTVNKPTKEQAADGQKATHGDEVGPGGEVIKTVCFDSQPQFAPSQEVTQCDGDEESQPGSCLNTEVQPKSILKIPKESAVSTTTPNSAFQCQVKSPPIDLTMSPSQPNHIQTPPPVNKQVGPRARLLSISPMMPSSRSALKQVEVTPPNSPSLLASVRRDSQAKPKSERRRSTPYPKGAQTRVKLTKEVDEEEGRSEVDEQEEGASVEDEEVEMEDRGLWLKPQRLDFVDISELEIESNCTDQEGSTCDMLNTMQEIQFSSQSTEGRDMNRSPDMFSSQDDILSSQY